MTHLSFLCHIQQDRVHRPCHSQECDCEICGEQPRGRMCECSCHSEVGALRMFFCPCCGRPMADDPDDAPFCWTCGLYTKEDPAKCDEPTHKKVPR